MKKSLGNWRLKLSAVALLLVFIFYVIPSFRDYYNWRIFPESEEAFLAQFQEGKGFGHCVSGDYSAIPVPVTRAQVRACFRHAVLVDRQMPSDHNPYNDSIRMTYQCATPEFAGQVSFLFFRVGGAYWCDAKLAADLSGIELDDTLIVTHRPDQTLLFELLVYLFG